MASCSDIIAALDELLSPGDFADAGPNGLQVTGAAAVTRVATAVTATRAVIERAVAGGAELLLVHHGLFQADAPAGIRGVLEGRLKPLIKGDVSLAAYHLPLDGHAVHGNNALLAERLGADRHEPFAVHRGATIGRAAHFSAPVPLAELVARVAAVCEQGPLIQGPRDVSVRGLGIVSGSGADFLHEAAAAGLDALLTGETRERIMGEAAELGVPVIAAGHYATETFGVRRLGDWLAERFGIEHVWIDAPNPV